MHLDRKLFISKIKVLQLLPLEDSDWNLAVAVLVLSDPLAGQADPPGRGSLVVHLKVMNPVGRHRLDDRHVVDEGLAARLTARLLVVLDDLVFAVGVGGLFLQHVGREQGILLEQGASSCVLVIVAVGRLEAQRRQLEHDIALDFEEASPDEAARLQVEQLHGLVVRKVGNGF